MPITHIPPDEAVTAAALDAEWIAGLIALAQFITAHPGIRKPEPGTLNIRVRGTTRGQRISDLDVIAEQWGVNVTEKNGDLFAERWFGGQVRVEAHIRAEDWAARAIARTDAKALEIVA